MRSSAIGGLGVAAVGLVAANVWAGVDSRVELDTAAAESARLTAVIEVQQYCRARQEQLVADLIEGRVSLAAAADELLEVSRARPDWLRGVAGVFTDPSERVRVARVLALCVTVETRDDPPRYAEVTGRVAAELDRMAANPD
jgi:hypothetical protein